jgi:hypothetical protein
MYSMKNMKQVLNCLIAFVLVFQFTTVKADNGNNSPNQDKRVVLAQKLMEMQDISSSEQLYESKALKKAGKVAKKLGLAKGKDKVDFKTDPDRWMWFWLFGWGAALALTIIDVALLGTFGIWYLSGLLWTAGSVCGLIFLLKKLEVID